MKQKTLLFLKTKKHRLRELSVICTACIVNWNDYQVNCLEYTQYYHYNYNGCRYNKDLPGISPLCQVFTRCVNGKHNFTSISNDLIYLMLDSNIVVAIER